MARCCQAEPLSLRIFAAPVRRWRAGELVPAELRQPPLEQASLGVVVDQRERTTVHADFPARAPARPRQPIVTRQLAHCSRCSLGWTGDRPREAVVGAVPGSDGGQTPALHGPGPFAGRSVRERPCPCSVDPEHLVQPIGERLSVTAPAVVAGEGDGFLPELLGQRSRGAMRELPH